MRNGLRASLSVPLLAGTVLVAGSPAGAGSAPPTDIRLTWSASPKTTQTIGWRSDARVSSGAVQYAASNDELTTIPAPAPERLDTNIGAVHLFTVTLRDLEPGTRYRYRVGDGVDSWSPEYTFETEAAADDAFEFLVFGDSHEKQGAYTVWRDTVEEAYRDNPGARFTVSLGDLIYSGKDYSQWQTWFAACQDVIARIPVLPVIGDHEPRGVTSKDKWQRPEYFAKLFRVPQNGPAGFEGEVYSLDYGPAHIAVLNSSFTYEFTEPADRQAMIDAEVAWLDADLAATAKPWKIVIYHDATYNLSADRAGALTKAHFGPVIDRHHVDVVLNAHEHAVARSYFIKDEGFVANAAEGTLYYVVGRAGDNAKDSLGPKIWHPFFYDPQAQTCYLLVRGSAERLAITTKLQDGTVVDTFVIDRADPAASTPAVPFGPYQDVRFAAFGHLFQWGKPPQRNQAGEWFVDVGALAAYMSGRFDAATSTLVYDDGDIRLELADDAFLDATKAMVSLAGLTQVGFRCRYHEAMNLVMVERWRD